MTRVVKFLVVFVLGLAALAAIALWFVTDVTDRWFDKDLRLRSQLAVASAEPALAADLRAGAPRLAETLDAITRDERIMGAAACRPDGSLIAATAGFPTEVACDRLAARVVGSGTLGEARDLGDGRIHVGAVPVVERGTLAGVIVLVQDLAFLERRETAMRQFLLIAFLVVAAGVSILTVVAGRVARRGWTLDLRRALRGAAPTTAEFQPLVRDVHTLVDELAQDREREVRGGAWTPERLKAILTQHLHGERVVILANREPYIHEHGADGVRVVHPASGLVTALEPVMRACSGVWVAHGAGSADRDTVDAHDRVRVPPGEESYVVRRVWLSPEEERGYYYGFSNEGLWPLCHVAHARPLFRAEDWEHYVAVNRRFADAVCAETDSDDPIVLVQDYHFALAPRMIRERLPRATILSFWHIPWPSAERIGICPWREELIAGLLGSSIVGFHTQQHCNNFIDSVDAFMESRIDREQTAVVQGGRRTLVRAYPISIEWPVRWLADQSPIDECRAGVRAELGLAPDALLGVGIDRLDYTKGVEERLKAVDELLAHHPELRGRFTFVQLAAPSRTKIERYRELNEQVERVAAAINERWGVPAGDGGGRGYQPIILLRAHHEPPTVFRYYRAADLCYVSSLHDGMNLVAKEFVAARDDERGVLLLSQFTGAARDMTEALIVNPYDIRGAAEALAAALRMSPEEQRERMRSMRRLVSEFNVYRWAGRMLVAAAEVRRRERLSGRLASSAERSAPAVA
jgi:trehalose 6-phosphate synthase